MPKQKMFKFNVKNVKYAMPNELGGYDEPKDLAYVDSLALEADYNETKLFGDGQILAILGDDKGKKGTLSVINIEEDYEIACGRSMKIEGGIADIQQRASVQHPIYYEVEAIREGKKITIKNWLFGCITGKANETYKQTQEDPTINMYDYPLTVLGTNLKKSTGTEDYKDENGNEVKVYRLTSYPEDTGYSTMETAVPDPKELVGA